MAKKKHIATTADLPVTPPEPMAPKHENVWDPSGNNTQPEQPATPPSLESDDQDAQLAEFIAAVRAVADPNTEIETPGSA